MDSDQPSDPAKDNNSPERNASLAPRSNNEEKAGVLRAALISHFVPTQTSVNKALDPRRRSLTPEDVEQRTVGTDNNSTTKQLESQLEASDPPVVLSTSTATSALPEHPLSSTSGTLNAKLASISGIVTTDVEDRVVPPTMRPNGSGHAMKKVRPGYRPPEDKALDKAPSQIEFDRQSSESFKPKDVPEVSQETENISQTSRNQSARVQRTWSPAGDEQPPVASMPSAIVSPKDKISRPIPPQILHQAQLKGSVPGLQRSKPEQEIQRPTTPPNRSTKIGHTRTPLSTGEDQSPGSNHRDHTPGTLEISPAVSPPRPSDLQTYSPNVKAADQSPVQITKKASRTRVQRPMWYDDKYVIRQKNDVQYNGMEKKLRVERYYLRGSKTYAITAIHPRATGFSRKDSRTNWLARIEGQQQKNLPINHPGFTIVVDQAVAGAISRPWPAHPARHNDFTPSSPLEPSYESPWMSDNEKRSLEAMNQDTPEEVSPDAAALPESPTPTGRAIRKRKHSSGNSPKARKPKKTKRSIKRTDTYSRLLNDNRGEVEYVKGEGIRRVNNGLDSSSPDSQSEGEAASESSATYNLKLVLTDFIELKNDPVVKHGEGEGLLRLRWIADEKLFITSHKNIDVEGTHIRVEQILKVQYGYNPSQIHIEYGPGKVSGIVSHQHDMCLVLDCTPAQYTTLMGTLSRHVGAMKVNRMLDSMYFSIKMRELRKVVAKGVRKNEEPSLGTVKNLPLKPTDATSPGLNTGSNISTTARGSLQAASPAKIAIRAKVSSAKCDNAQRNIAENLPGRTGPATTKSVPSANVDPSIKGGRSPPPQQPGLSLGTATVRSGFRYRSGQDVAKGDLVVRRRDPATIANGQNKQDKYDTFDGPYSILKIPDCIPGTLHSGSRPNTAGKEGVRASSLNEKSKNEYGLYNCPRRMLGVTGFGLICQHRMKVKDDEEPNFITRAEKEIMLQTMIKLKFPRGCAVDSWTKLDRLIPVLEFDPEKCSRAGDISLDLLDDNDGAMPLALGPAVQPGTVDQGATKKVTHLSINTPIDTDGELPTGMVNLCKDVYVKVHYVAPDSPTAGSHYEVSKLRGKRLRRLQGHDAKGLKTDVEDPWIRRYVKSKGSPKKGAVLVAEYLVHWRQADVLMHYQQELIYVPSGWPSESDTWELGKGNIPENFLQVYGEKTDPYRNLAEEDEDKLSGAETMLYVDDLQVVGKGDKRRTSDGSSQGKRGRPRKSNETIIISSSPPATSESVPKSSAKKKGARTFSQAKLIDDDAGEGEIGSEDEEAGSKISRKRRRNST
ncbi:MAG: hypothetical protein M1812_000850 [Candelaria pacifica]|nr:MAG: hypothetical protein M1812_000850 [Candelaria pacifica]